MHEDVNELVNSIMVILAVLCVGFVFFRMFYARIKDHFSPVRTEKAQVVDKYVADSFSKIHGSAAKKPQYIVVFAAGNRKRSFRVSEFSYSGYRVRQRGTLKFKGSRLIDFS